MSGWFISLVTIIARLEWMGTLNMSRHRNWCAMLTSGIFITCHGTLRIACHPLRMWELGWCRICCLGCLKVHTPYKVPKHCGWITFSKTLVALLEWIRNLLACFTSYISLFGITSLFSQFFILHFHHVGWGLESSMWTPCLRLHTKTQVCGKGAWSAALVDWTVEMEGGKMRMVCFRCKRWWKEVDEPLHPSIWLPLPTWKLWMFLLCD